MTILHQSVLLKESIQALNIQKNGVYVDGTFGRGGHTKAILEALGPQGRVIAFDKDLDAVFHAQKTIQDQRFTMVHASFSELESIMTKYDLFGLVNGVLFDLGVSSPQLDESERGFSFMQEGPLDMRMDRTQAEDASTFIQRASVEEMTHVFRHFGEERFALRIARAIEAARQTGPIQTTSVLAEIVKKANPKWEKHKHPATRVFQAIRIHINGELEDLSKGLRAAVNVLAPNGRLAVISFHSLEDRVVKQFMKKEEEGEVLPIGVPVKAQDLPKYFRRVGKAVKPSEQEVQTNVRARSAVLRIGEKL